MHDCGTNTQREGSIPHFSEAVKFHGHTCPGLTMGYRAAEAAIKELKAGRDVDEELVAIVENDACGVDAIQVATGCTLGKGNLIFKDHGKQVYTFINRNTGDAVRVSLKASFSVEEQDPALAKLRAKVMSGKATKKEAEEFRRRMESVSNAMLAAPIEEMFEVKHVKAKIPEKARIFKSVKCKKCGEMVAEHRARVQDGGFVCIPCYKEYTRGW
ncbi:Formylmethanofuran dehydrogenase subunit E [Methanocella conradii HZ254]|uniref:Formylmethanofuran dehydrogenase subunit E n=1 Tax=Methanocella conradii (strain DSM 24694 / JCM 17849 / CGMCC 1.5162 / HZ254) TaxID=1041930 RepID=H8IAQ6_METCZ|nr:FmdE family protein [Methanocella conradii]AFD00561.1 Formylmethanofuran dehydrogenase subunit E [Methanocella conradii HZ254]